MKNQKTPSQSTVHQALSQGEPGTVCMSPDQNWGPLPWAKCILDGGSQEDGSHGGHLNLGKNTNAQFYANHWMGPEGAVAGQSSPGRKSQSWEEAKLCPLPELLDPRHLLHDWKGRTIFSSESTGKKDTGLWYCVPAQGDAFLSTTHGLFWIDLFILLWFGMSCVDCFLIVPLNKATG